MKQADIQIWRLHVVTSSFLRGFKLGRGSVKYPAKIHIAPLFGFQRLYKRNCHACFEGMAEVCYGVVLFKVSHELAIIGSFCFEVVF